MICIYASIKVKLTGPHISLGLVALQGVPALTSVSGQGFGLGVRFPFAHQCYNRLTLCIPIWRFSNLNFLGESSLASPSDANSLLNSLKVVHPAVSTDVRISSGIPLLLKSSCRLLSIVMQTTTQSDKPIMLERKARWYKPLYKKKTLMRKEYETLMCSRSQTKAPLSTSESLIFKKIIHDQERPQTKHWCGSQRKCTDVNITRHCHVKSTH